MYENYPFFWMGGLRGGLGVGTLDIVQDSSFQIIQGSFESM